ncbi:MAG: carboxypeptidase-like regulatory domain-containing protein, partial [Gammaproteobacteria bacterium]|nr:carboxypeptidase-like regulatory domain-containing protein [Gammaproteobacteria bacterium]
DDHYPAYLPAGSYSLTVSSPGDRVATASKVPIIAQRTTVRNFDLAPGPTILSVDSGAWYYDSQSLYLLPSVVI